MNIIKDLQAGMRTHHVKCAECVNTLFAPIVPSKMRETWDCVSGTMIVLAYLRHTNWHILRDSGKYICPQCWSKKPRGEEYGKLQADDHWVAKYKEYIEEMNK